ncbi:DUF885 domain-containing protein [Steroidobacter flavus]|uniref:DUF885 domain-containing protein n=1 Tax=Steroidobacter flavus TaxID=1842136 RepID=A0ABV8SN81_9GAMM
MKEQTSRKAHALALAVLATLATASCSTAPTAQQPLPANQDARFNEFVDRAYKQELASDPTRRTELTLAPSEPSWTPAGLANDAELARKYTERLSSLGAQVDRQQLSPDQQIRFDIYRAALQNQLVRLRIKQAGYTIGANVFDPPRELTQLLIKNHKILSADDARNYLSRLQELPKIVDDTMAAAKEHHGRGIVMIDREYQRVADDARSLSQGAPCSGNGDQALAKDFRDKLKGSSIPAAEQAAFTTESNTVLAQSVCPAYAKFAQVVTELGKAGRADGLWALPNGVAVYEDTIEYSLGRRVDPEAVHQLGLREVERHQREIQQLTAKLGIPSGAAELDAYLAKKADLWVPNTDEGFKQYKAATEAMIAFIQTKLPDYFQYIPKSPLAVEWAATGPTGGGPSRGSYYTLALPDGSKPAIYNLAFWPGPERFSLVSLPTVTYHEAVPGHHMQMATAFELQGADDKLRFGHDVAYAEGWGLYAEQLAYEMGVYANDPYGAIGWRRALLERAVRLVIDTGVNYKHWSRKQAEDYQVSVLGGEASVNRFFNWPGQALGYYWGYQEIVRLRDKARQELGPRFDIKAFHHVVLKNGEMPLDVLERTVDRYIRETAARGAS